MRDATPESSRIFAHGADAIVSNFVSLDIPRRHVQSSPAAPIAQGYNVFVALRTVFGGASADVLGATAAAAAPTQLTDTAFNNSSQLRFSGVYFL